MYQHVQKFLDWGVKIASLAVTGPATWIVAGQLFRDITHPGLLFLMRLAAVFLVEGVLLSNWLLLEFDRQASSGIKARYAITALGMYAALLVIGWQHEGPTGLVFRLALLAALIGSSWDTYVYTWQKATARADKDISSSFWVRRYRRRLAIADAKEAVETEFELRSAQREVDRLVQLETIGAYKAERLTAVKVEHKREMAKIAPVRLDALGKLSQPEERQALPAGFPYPVDTARRQRARQQRDSRETKMVLLVDAVRDNPHASLRQLGQAVDLAPETVRRYLRQMESDGVIHRNGNGIEALPPAVDVHEG